MEPLRILFETDRLIAVDKDRNTAVHGGTGLLENETLLYQVKRYLGDRAPEFITPAHRLDRNTRGPVLFAKDRETARLLNRAFAGGKVRKIYHALLERKLERKIFVEADIVKGSHKKSAVKNPKILADDLPKKEDWLAARDSSSLTISGTMIEPMGSYGDTTLCAIETWTGRYHQIRAVCEAIGHPVCGDNKYNHDPRIHYNRRTNPGHPDNQALLCKTLEIPSLGVHLTSGFDLV